MAGSSPSKDNEPRVASDQHQHTRAWKFRYGVPIAFFIIGIIVYSLFLGHPDAVVFDEVHYLTAARAFADGDWINPDWSDDRPWNWEHPPLAKYWMALSINVLGDEPEHYRLPSVVYGAAGLAGVSVLARRMFQSEVAAVLAPLLLLFEPMWYLHSRMAMLEIFVAAPMIWAFAFALGDKDWEPWAAIWVAALALAAKYTALFLFPPLFLLILWRRVGIDTSGLFGFREALRAFAMVFVVPMLFVLFTWLPFLRLWTAQRGFLYALDHTGFLFKQSLSWGSQGPTDHPEASPPLHWLPMGRPTWYHVERGEGVGLEQEYSVIYALGNPVIWWLGLALALLVVVPALFRVLGALRTARLEKTTWRVHIRRGDWRDLATVGLAFFIFLAAYAPFFLLSRIAFLYYMTLLVPYIALTVTGALLVVLWRTRTNEADRLSAEAKGWPEPATPSPEEMAPVLHRMRVTVERLAATRWTGWAIVGAFVVGAFALAVFWAPLYTGMEVERSWVENGWDLIPWADRLDAYSSQR